MKNDTTTATQTELKTALQITAAIAEAIRQAGSVSSGTLYACAMTHINLEAYNKIIAILKHTGLVSESGHMLTWIGPEVQG